MPKGQSRFLTLSQQVAIEAINADIVRLKHKLRMVLEEAGLNPEGSYSIKADGSIEEVSA